MLILLNLGIFALFVPFVFLASRSSPEEKKMRARFAALKAGRLSTGSATKDFELLRSVEDRPSGLLRSVVDWMSARLQLESLIVQANSQSSPQVVLRSCGIAAIGGAGFVSLLTRVIYLGLFAGMLFGYIPVLLLRIKAKSRAAAMNRVLPEVSDMIARALRAGHSVSAALGIVAEEAPEPARSGFGDVFQKQKFGLPLREALLDLVHKFPSEDLKVLVTAILVQRDTGGNLVQVLERTAAVIRERQKLAGDVRVHTAQGRLTGWILCLLPVLMLGVLTLTNPSYPKALLDDPLGRKLLYVGVGLLCLGGYIIQQIVKGIEV